MQSNLYINQVESNDEKDSVFNHVEIDTHSLALLKKGPPNQRYAVVGWIDTKTKKLHLHFRPSFIEGIKDENRKLFAEEDIVEAKPGITGVVHQRVIDSVQKYYGSQKESPPYLYDKGVANIGMSFYKRSAHILAWTNRSTRNAEAFSLNELAEYCLYFDTKQTLERPEYTRAFHLARSLEPKATEKISEQVKKILLNESKSEMITEEEKLLEKIVLEEIGENKYCANFTYEKEWKEIENDKNKIEEYLMRTIYIASGLKDAKKESAYPQDDNDIVIKNVLRIAKEHKIRLDLDRIYSLSPLSGKDSQPSALVDLLNFDLEHTKGLSALMLAAKRGDLKTVKLLIENKANIDKLVTTGSGVYNALTTAFDSNNVDIINYLIDSKATINVKDQPNPPTPLILAAKAGNLTIVKRLLDAKADMDMKDSFGRDAFLSALNADKFDVAKYLIENKSNINATTNDNYSAIMSLAQWNTSNNTLDMLNYLIEKKANVNLVNKRDESALHLAVTRDGLDFVRQLIEAKATIDQPDKSGKTPTSKALSYGNFNVMQYLLEKKADLNLVQTDDITKGLNASLYLKRYDQLAIILQSGILKDKKVDLNDDILKQFEDNEPVRLLFSYAIENYDKNSLLWIMEHKYLFLDQNMIVVLFNKSLENNDFELFAPYLNREIPTLGKFLEYVNDDNTDKLKEIKALVSKSKPEAFSRMINNIKDEKGNLALHLAALNGNYDTMKFLLDNKADLDVKNDQKLGVIDQISLGVRQPIFYNNFQAVRDILREFKEYKIDFNVKDARFDNKSAKVLLAEKLQDRARKNNIEQLEEIKMALPETLFKEILNAKDSKNNNALLLALNQNAIRSAAWLITNGADPLKQKYSTFACYDALLDKAIDNNNLVLIKKLLQNGRIKESQLRGPHSALLNQYYFLQRLMDEDIQDPQRYIVLNKLKNSVLESKSVLETQFRIDDFVKLDNFIKQLNPYFANTDFQAATMSAYSTILFDSVENVTSKLISYVRTMLQESSTLEKKNSYLLFGKPVLKTIVKLLNEQEKLMTDSTPHFQAPRAPKKDK